jgi:hypothetical protein
MGNTFSEDRHSRRRAMGKLIGKFALLTLVVLTVGVRTSHAQIATQMAFKISQTFVVGNTTLPAGSYIIRPVQGTDQAVIEITNTSGKPAVMAEVDLVTPDAAQAGGQLVFNKYKSVLALSQIFPGGGNQGYQLTAGHPEKLAAKTETPTKQSVPATAK